VLEDALVITITQRAPRFEIRTPHQKLRSQSVIVSADQSRSLLVQLS
jgi:hypothetical protein